MPQHSRDFLTPDPALAAGTSHQGFVVEYTEALPEYDGHAYVMRHSATGARLMWIATPDTNRSFAIAFGTPPADDTGVFHILEHSVLCGSKRYPVKEPFVHLIKSSMQTFLNALTFPDKTMYPVASTNVTDLENLMGIYLDAVLHPNIYTRPRIFEQEGWHYEIDEEANKLLYNGVVFNEMKGSLANPERALVRHLNAELFCDTCYGWESGGDPAAIPSLSYEQFIDTHARHYKLANSYTILYGDLDIERELRFIGERFDEAPEREAGDANPLELQKARKVELVHKEMITSPEQACAGVGYVVGSALDGRNRILATEVLFDVLMGSNEAPLKRALLEAGIANDIDYMLADGVLQPWVALIARGAHEGAAEQLRAITEQTCAHLVAEGLRKESLEAALSALEFVLREGDSGAYGDGVLLSMQALSSWLYDDARACEYLHYEDSIKALREGIDAGLFEQLLDEIVCQSTHNAAVALDAVAAPEISDEELRLASVYEAMSSTQKDEVRTELTALRAEQEAADTPEALATLPRLRLNDLDEGSPDPDSHDVEAASPVTVYDVATHGITYIYYRFGLGELTEDELPYVSVLTELLGHLATHEHSALELDILIEGGLGDLTIAPEVWAMHHDRHDVRGQLVVSASVLSEKAILARDIPAEIWSSTILDDAERVRDLLTQRKVNMEQGFMGAGHAAALARMSSYYLTSARAAELLSGVDNYRFVRELLDNFDERWPKLLSKLENLCARIFVANNLEIGYAGDEANLAQMLADKTALRLTPAAIKRSSEERSRLNIREPQPANEAFIVPGNVAYVGEGFDGADAGLAFDGTWQLASRIISYSYMWHELREKGGAYGCGYRVTGHDLAQFYSFRDPNVDASIERYEGAAGWLAQTELSEEEFSGYVISTVASYDAPLKPRALVRRADAARVAGTPHNLRLQRRTEVLATTQELLRERAHQLDELPQKRSLCVFGAKELIESSKLAWQVFDLLG